MDIDSSCFRESLPEIYCALHADQPLHTLLVPNLTGRSLFDSRAGYGWLYRHCYTKDKLNLLTMRSLWHLKAASSRCCDSGIDLINDLRVHVCRLCQGFGSEVEDERYAYLRQKLMDYEQAYLPFYRIIKEDPVKAATFEEYVNEIHQQPCSVEEIEGHYIWLWLRDILSMGRKFMRIVVDLLYRLLDICIGWFDTASLVIHLQRWEAADKVWQEQQQLQDPRHIDVILIDKLLKEMDAFLPFVQFEVYSGMDWPFRALSELACSTKITDIDKFNEWVQKLSRNNSDELVALWKPALECFYQLLKAIVKSQGIAIKTFEELQAILYGNMSVFLERDDRQHLEWRQGIQKGDVLKDGSKAIVIGAVLNNVFMENNRYRHFAIQGVESERRIIRVANNCHILAIEKYRQEKELDGCRSAQMYSISSDGRWVEVEKLKTKLNDGRWCKESTLQSSDQNHLLQISSQIRYFMKHDIIPIPFRASEYMFSNNGVIKRRFPAKKVVPIGGYAVIKNYILDIAGGNEAVLRDLIKESGLDESGLNESEALSFWRDLIIKSCGGKQCNPKEAAIFRDPVKINDSVIDKGVKLLRELEDVRKECRQKLLGTTEVGDEKFEKLLNTYLLKHYNLNQVRSSILPNNLSDKVVEDWANIYTH